jgi:hypothetical protein
MFAKICPSVFRSVTGALVLATAALLASVNLGRAASAASDDAKPPKPPTGEAKSAPQLVPDEVSGGTSAAKEASPAAATPVQKAATPKPPALVAPVKKVKPLSPEMAERRDRVRKLLAALRTQPFNTQQNTCTDILDFCRAFGCDTELNDNLTSGQKVNGITCLCWNIPCAGYELITVSDGHLAPRVGYGYQTRSSEFAAVLALSNVPSKYPARSGKNIRTVADLIEYEKLTCRPGADMALKLVALAHYVQEPSWKDNLGGEWTLRRMVKEELERAPSTYAHAATDRLLGLSSALERFRADKVPLEGDLNQARKYVDESITYAYSAQNSDGSWGRPTNRDYAGAVANTARMLEWLVVTLPANRLEEPQIVRGIDSLYTMFSSTHYQTYIPMMSSREISAAMHAAYVLNSYDQQVFVPADGAKTEKPEPKAASLGAEAR